MTSGVRSSGDNWIWITGEKFSYPNWYAGEPNNGFGDEDISNTAGKYPFFNIENSGFICEWD